jgi:hypothetical protein
MAIRPPTDKERVKNFEAWAEKQIGRAYFLWLGGLMLEALAVHANKVTFGGIEVSLNRPEALPGLLYAAVLFVYVSLICYSLVISIALVVANRQVQKASLYWAATAWRRNRRTLISRTAFEVQVLERIARMVYWFVIVSTVIIVFLPLLHILIFKHGALLSGLLLFL